MARRYYTLDVFAGRPLAGNPLAVILDAQDLDTASMQAIARELNLSETVFVLRADDARHRARIRIFTPGMEMPFAGHPTVGTAVLLAILDGSATDDMLFGLEETVGVVSCSVSARKERGAFARFELPSLPKERGAPADVGTIARALGLAAADIGFENHRPCVFDAGFPFTFVPVRDLAAAGRIRIGGAEFAAAFEREGLSSAYAYTRHTVDADASFHARMFSPSDGIPEDPATGAAAAALAGVIMRFDEVAAGEHLFRIEQGLEMGRPSLIELGMTVEGVSLASATIGGSAVIVGEGLLHV